MRNSTIFTLAILAGLIAFIYRLATVTHEDLGVEPAEPSARRATGPEREARELAEKEDFLGAARIMTEVHSEGERLDQSGWRPIGQYLVLAGAPRDVIPKWREIAPQQFLEEGVAEGWACYFVGINWLGDNEEYAQDAFELGEQAFEDFLENRSQFARDWDWLYLARTRMRMEEDESAAEAMEDVRSHIAAAIEVGGDSLQFAQTAGRTWAEIGRPDEAAPVWAALTDARIAEGQHPLVAANQWRRYARGMINGGERDAGRLGINEAVRALSSVDLDTAPNLVPIVDLRRDLGLLYARAEEPQKSDALLHDSLELAREISAGSDDPDRHYQHAQSAAAVGAIDETLDALEMAIEYGLQNPYVLEAENVFDPIRAEPRFEAMMEALLEAAAEREEQFLDRSRSINSDEGR